MIFRKVISGHFDILMSQYGQVKKSHAFWGCAKMVFWLHTARTEKPNTSQRHPSASDFHEKHSDNPRHPPDIPQTPPDIPQTPLDISREHDMPTDNNRRQPTPPDILKQHLSMSWGVWRCLLTSVGMFCSLERPWGCLGDVWGVSGGI